MPTSGFTPRGGRPRRPAAQAAGASAVHAQALEARLRAQLRSGERLLWTGQPLRGAATMNSFKIWIFAIPWTLLTLFLLSVGLGPALMVLDGYVPNEAPLWHHFIFPLFVLPFVGFGVLLLLVPFFVSRVIGNTLYALTNSRAIVMTMERKGQEILSYSLSELDKNISLVEKPDGSGHVLLLAEPSISGQHKKKHLDRLGFEHVPQAGDVHRRLLEAIEAQRRRTASS